MTFGVDYAWHPHPSYTLMKEKDVEFVVRYVSGGNTKDITKAEAQGLSTAGFNIALVWEKTAGRALQGFDTGHADARAALAQATKVGMPKGRPIYFAVDFDAWTDSQLAKVKGYFNGILSVLPKSQVGVYGGAKVMKALDPKIDFLWQTLAWSNNTWYANNTLEQYKVEVHSGWGNGVDLDYNRAKKDDYGQWKIGWVPTPPKPWKWDGKAPGFSPILKKDIKSLSKVKALQSALNKVLGGTDLKVDGEYGDLTVKAVKVFQKAHPASGMADGEYGEKTYKELAKALGA